jgi:hypothetical protein
VIRPLDNFLGQAGIFVSERQEKHLKTLGSYSQKSLKQKLSSGSSLFASVFVLQSNDLALASAVLFSRALFAAAAAPRNQLCN